jgi:hypothetical protein
MGDWIVFMSGSRGVDPADRAKFTEILLRHNPVGLSTSDAATRRRFRYVKGWDSSKDSGIHKSASLEEIKACKTLSGGSAVYANYEDVRAVIRELVEADLGASVVVSGIFDEVHGALEEAGKEPHTVNMSAETFGRLDLLPEPKVLEITTMCGHHMVSSNLVKHLAEEVRKGRMPVEVAAVEMAKQCTCNFFNVERAKNLLNEYIAEQEK